MDSDSREDAPEQLESQINRSQHTHKKHEIKSNVEQVVFLDATPCATGNANKDGYSKPQSIIRESIANALNTEEYFSSRVSSAIAVSCHPWPDEIISKSCMKAITAELLPALNLNHMDLCEVASDRLLRLSESMRFEQNDDLSDWYYSNAEVIQSYLADRRSNANYTCPHIARGSIVQSPLGIGVPRAQTVVTEGSCPASGAEDEFLQPDIWTSLVAALLSASAMQGGVRDVGIICGGTSIGLTINQIAFHHEVKLPVEFFDAYLLKLDSRSRDVLVSRTFKLDDSRTLEDVADRWSVTRERIRQIEMQVKGKLIDNFSTTFLTIGSRLLENFVGSLTKTDCLHEAAITVANGSYFRNTLAAFVLELFGPWLRRGCWSYHQSIEEDIASLRVKIASKANTYGIIESKHISAACDHLFANTNDRDQFLKEELRFGYACDNWIVKDTLQYQFRSALKKIGQPATREEIADLLNIPLNRIAGVLGNQIDGVVRADRYRWGFNEWVEDIYDGIVGEIEQRIDEYKGAVPIQVLLREIPSKFNVAEASVRAYLATSAFIVEDDIVRSANADDYVHQHPSSCSSAVMIDGQWGGKTRIYDRHLNGYSLGVNFDVAFANGVRPEDNLVVPVEGHNYNVSLIWRSHSINRLIDVGRVAGFLTSQGYKDGDWLYVIPSRTTVRLLPCSVGEDNNSIPSLLSKKETTASNSVKQDRKSTVSDPLLDLLEDS